MSDSVGRSRVRARAGKAGGVGERGELVPDRDIDAEHRGHRGKLATRKLNCRYSSVCIVPTEKGALPINILRESTMVEA